MANRNEFDILPLTFGIESLTTLLEAVKKYFEPIETFAPRKPRLVAAACLSDAEKLSYHVNVIIKKDDEWMTKSQERIVYLMSHTDYIKLCLDACEMQVSLVQRCFELMKMKVENGETAKRHDISSVVHDLKLKSVELEYHVLINKPESSNENDSEQRLLAWDAVEEKINRILFEETNLQKLQLFGCYHKSTKAARNQEFYRWIDFEADCALQL